MEPTPPIIYIRHFSRIVPFVRTFSYGCDKFWSGSTLAHDCNTLASSLSAPTNVVPLSEISLMQRPFRIVKRSNAAMNSSMVRPSKTSMCTARVDRQMKITIHALSVEVTGCLEQHSIAGGRPRCFEWAGKIQTSAHEAFGLSDPVGWQISHQLFVLCLVVPHTYRAVMHDTFYRLPCTSDPK